MHLRRHSQPVTDQPRPGTHLVVRVAGGVEQAGRLDSLENDAVMVAALPRSPRPGTPVRLSWGSERGWSELETTFDEVVLARVPLWRLRPRGGVEVHQRRLHTRASVVSPMQIVSAGLMPTAALLTDISEGGLRCLTSTGTVVHQGERVSVQVQTPGLTCTVAGTVVRRSVEMGARVELAVRFSQPVRHADEIRREVMRLQREERAS